MTKRTAAPLHRELPWLGFVDDGVVMTKRGELLAGARLTGASFECRAAADLDYVSLRWTRALKSLAPGWRIRWQVCKRRLDSLPQRTPSDPLAERARRVRRAHLLDKGLYSIETYVFWTWDPKLTPAPAAGAGTASAGTLLSRAALWLSPERTKQVLASHVDAARVRFESAVASFCGLVDDVTHLEPLQGEGLFRALALSANSRSAAFEARSVSPHGLDRQLALSDIEGYRDHLLLDAERVETYALLDPPAASRAHLFGEILDLDAELDLACEWSREDTAKSRRRMSSARRHYHQKRYSMLAHASAGDAPPQAQGALEDRAAQAEAVQLGEALRELEVDGMPFGEHSLSVVLRGREPTHIEAVRPELLRIAAAADARFHRETYNGLNAWFAMAPGNHRRQLRHTYLSAAVAADLAPLWAVSEGEPRDQHLGDEHLAIFETSRRTPFYYAAHAGDIAHTLVIGATGSGKSFLLNFLLAQGRKYEPRVCILDLGGSYRQLTELVGGAYLHLQLDTGGLPCELNPFRALEPTAENLQFLVSFVRMLLEIEGAQCDAGQRAELRAQIQALYELEPEARTLSSLHGLLPANLRGPLGAWIQGGVWGSVFDNTEDSLTLADWQAIDLAGAAGKPELARALLYYLLHRLGTMITAPEELGRWKLLVVDEAWRFLADPHIGAYLGEGLKTWRKCNAGVVLATQSPGDATANASLCRTVAESCLTKIFLANPELDPSGYAEAFGLRPAEAEAIRALVPKRQLLLHRPGFAQVLELSVDRRSYWLYTTNPVEAARRRDAIRDLGFERGLDSLMEDTEQCTTD